MIRPQWEWALDDAEGRRLSEPVTPVFTAQYDAEQWLGEHWRTLAAQGVQAVGLLHEGVQATPTLTLPLI